MIHSLSGGVLADGGIYTFAKVDVDGTPGWYLAPRMLAAGTRVIVPFGRTGVRAQGRVVRCENCTPQTAPVPMGRGRSIVSVLPDPQENA